MAGRCEHYGQRKQEKSVVCERVPAIHIPDVGEFARGSSTLF
jgi:hypothetical protein